MLAEFLANVLQLAVRVLVLALGMVLAACLLLVLLVLAVAWGLRALWARLTGQPVNPWVMRVNPRSAFQAANRWQSTRRTPPGTTPGRAVVDIADVTDVQPKDR